MNGGSEHQNTVLRQYQEYLITKGIKDRDLLRRAASILVHESESLTFDRTHDDNFGFGICGRYVGIKFSDYKISHPEEVAPEGQIRWCGDRFIHSLKTYGDKKTPRSIHMPDGRNLVITEGQFRMWVFHNCPACASVGQNTTHLKPAYAQRVQYAYEKLSM